MFLEDRRDPIEYDPIFREYYIKIAASHNVLTLEYCPWCGRKLPSKLRDAFFDILESEYRLELSIADINHSAVPPEFQSDEWWKKRGL